MFLLIFPMSDLVLSKNVGVVQYSNKNHTPSLPRGSTPPIFELSPKSWTVKILPSLVEFSVFYRTHSLQPGFNSSVVVVGDIFI